jgi:hypothetical protein
MRRARHVARIREIRNAYRMLVGKLEGKRLFRRTKRKLVDSIRIDLGVIRWEDVDWMYLAQDRN